MNNHSRQKYTIFYLISSTCDLLSHFASCLPRGFSCSICTWIFIAFTLIKAVAARAIRGRNSRSWSDKRKRGNQERVAEISKVCIGIMQSFVIKRGTHKCAYLMNKQITEHRSIFITRFAWECEIWIIEIYLFLETKAALKR